MKKIRFIGIIVTIVLVTIIGNKLYLAHEENVAKHIFLEWIQAIDSEEIGMWGALDTRNGVLPENIKELELVGEQKQEFCQALMSISNAEVDLGPGSPNPKSLDLWMSTRDQEHWHFRFDGEVVYIYEIPEKLREVNGWWPWEIRNEKLNEFLSGLLEQ